MLTTSPDTHRDPALIVRDATREYGGGRARVTALRSVSLEVAPGEVVVVHGESGAGKSTLLRLCGCLDTPTSGIVRVDGEDVLHIGADRRADMRRTRVGYVFQEYNLVSVLSAVENVALPLELGNSRGARRTALAALDEMGVADLADRYTDDMSGGQRQRVAIARALVGERSLIVADEPTGALDSETSRVVREALTSRAREHGAAVLVGTHDRAWSTVADRVLRMRDGTLHEDGRRP